MIERAKQSTILSAAFHFGHRALIHVYGFRIRSNDPERPSPATVAERTGSENSGAPWKGGAVIAVIEILLIFFCLAAFAGQLPPDVNESHYLTKAKHFWNPDYCPDDLFLSSSFSHWLFYASCGWLTQYVSLTTFAWIGRIATWILFATAWQRTARALNRQFGMSVFSIALFLILNDRFHLAGEWVIGGFEAKGIAYAFVLLGLNQVFRNRWNRAWPVLGIAAAFHVVVGGWAILATGIAYLLTQLIPIHPDDRRLLTTKNHESPSRQFIPLLIGFCIALIGILPPLLSEWSTAERIARQAHFVHVHERIHHHLMFESFGTMQIARFSFLIMTWAVFTGCFWNRVLFRRLNLFCAATLLVSFAGLILSGIAEPADGTGAAEFELANTATSLLRFYWFRIADFALPFGIAMATSVAITRSIKATENAASHKFAARLFCVLILAAFAFAVAHRYGDLRPLADKNSLPTYIDDPVRTCLLYTSPSPRDGLLSRMPSSA